jgi:hypothetical protein
MKRNRIETWFGRNTISPGWGPNTWEGWALTLVIVAAFFVIFVR